MRDSAGVPQMGASVLLFNRYERLIQRTLTNERGLFGFESLTPDLYSVRVSLASFVPAMKQKIAVQPGMQSLLYVDLASVLSSIELVYAAPGQGALMSDDWKWTLKASASTRPILRFLPDNPSDPTRIARGYVFAIGSRNGFRARHFAIWPQPPSVEWQCRLQRWSCSTGHGVPDQLQPRWIWTGSVRDHAAGLFARTVGLFCNPWTSRGSPRHSRDVSSCSRQYRH